MDKQEWKERCALRRKTEKNCDRRESKSAVQQKQGQGKKAQKGRERKRANHCQQRPQYGDGEQQRDRKSETAREIEKDLRRKDN
jgi:hypothetical protein